MGASNPLAKVKNTDVRAQYFDNPDGSYRWDFWLADGAFMATDKLKIKYGFTTELHEFDHRTIYEETGRALKLTRVFLAH